MDNITIEREEIEKIARDVTGLDWWELDDTYVDKIIDILQLVLERKKITLVVEEN